MKRLSRKYIELITSRRRMLIPRSIWERQLLLFITKVKCMVIIQWGLLMRRATNHKKATYKWDFKRDQLAIRNTPKIRCSRKVWNMEKNKPTYFNKTVIVQKIKKSHWVDQTSSRWVHLLLLTILTSIILPNNNLKFLERKWKTLMSSYSSKKKKCLN